MIEKPPLARMGREMLVGLHQGVVRIDAVKCPYVHQVIRTSWKMTLKLVRESFCRCSVPTASVGRKEQNLERDLL